MKTTAMLRRAQGVPIPVNKDSLYKPIERAARHFNPLHIPKPLQAALPFATKPKLQEKRKNTAQGYLRKRAVVMEPEEKKRHFLLQALATVRNEKVAKAQAKRSEKLAAREELQQKQQEVFASQERLAKKRKYREQGKAQQRRQRQKGV
jgi:ribosome biogenesis protein BMS1